VLRFLFGMKLLKAPATQPALADAAPLEKTSRTTP
jgi:hypothetical protein